MAYSFSCYPFPFFILYMELLLNNFVLLKVIYNKKVQKCRVNFMAL